MPYRFGDTQLRVLHDRLAGTREVLERSRVIVLEHVLPTTAEFVKLLKEFGTDVFRVIAKPYSIDQGALEKIKASGIEVIERTDYGEIERDIGGVIKSAQEASDADHRRIVLIDVGGYFAAPLVDASENDSRHIAGIVEDTTFGHNRYKQLAKQIPVPILSVARSELKEIEARFVGQDAVVAMDLMLREVGISISGRNALVIGYGMIGTNVARTLRRYDMKVHVYDKKDTRNLHAHADGFVVGPKRALLEKADIIFSATGSEAIYGQPALSFRDMEDWCKNKVVLASVGSRNSEFDIAQLASHARHNDLSKGIKGYVLTKDKQILVARNGTAVNFDISSIPCEVLDLVFSEIALCAMQLLGENHGYARGALNQVEGEFVDGIAKDWLRLSNNEL